MTLGFLSLRSGHLGRLLGGLGGVRQLPATIVGQGQRASGSLCRLRGGGGGGSMADY